MVKTINTINFSIITVCRNAYQDLQDTYLSLYQKDFDYKCFEWIVIDGNSSDNTLPFLHDIASTVPFPMHWHSEPDSGIYDAMNKGVLLAKGTYTLFLNAGDTIQRGGLKKVEIELGEGEPDIIFGGALLVFPNGFSIYRPPRNLKYVWHGLPANHQSTYYKTAMLKNNPYDKQYLICGDYYLLSKLFNENTLKVEYLDEPLVRFHIGGLSFQSPYLQLLEPYLIQKRILKLNVVFRQLSLIKRIVSTIIVRILFYVNK